MDWVLVLVLSVPAVWGLYLLILFVRMRVGGDHVEVEITGFQKEKFLGRALPIVRFEDEKDLRLVEVKKVAQLSYILGPPDLGARILVADLKGARSSVYGYLYLLAGGMMILPFMVALGRALDYTVFTAQAGFLLVFAMIMLGGWVGLRFIQRS